MDDMILIEGKVKLAEPDCLLAGVYVNNEQMEDLFANLEGKRIRLTIEVLPDEVNEDDEHIIGIPLRMIVKNDDACNSLGLNPYCVAEGANGDDYMNIRLSDAKKWGLI
jgi:hypothetical protein